MSDQTNLYLGKPKAKKRGWIGVDFDGTLAVHEPGAGLYPLGAPIPEMVTRVKCWLRNNHDVRIFTARMCEPDPKAVKALQDWCLEHLGEIIPLTNVKDYSMRVLYDDRAFSVERNTGRVSGWESEP